MLPGQIRIHVRCNFRHRTKMQRALPIVGPASPAGSLAQGDETIRKARTAFPALHDERVVLRAEAALSERLTSRVTPFRDRTTRPIMATDPEMP